MTSITKTTGTGTGTGTGTETETETETIEGTTINIFDRVKEQHEWR